MPDLIAPASNTPPDWAAHISDLLCPLCVYNLRGLTESRCPECGFAFTWQELLDAEQNKHLYLFEYGKGKNLVSFWKTYWRTCRPGKFWKDLNPAQPVFLFRLMVYWMIVGTILATWAFAPDAVDIVQTARSNLATRASPPAGWPMTPAELRATWPVPSELEFWKQSLLPSSGFARYYRPAKDIAFRAGMIILFWPWLTLFSTLVFRFSMRKAKIRTVHLLRAVVYSCDFGFLSGVLGTVAFFAYIPSDMSEIAEGWILVATAVFCGLVTNYRLAVAFDRYLRVHRPFATVLASQVISFLIVFVALAWIADFSRRV